MAYIESLIPGQISIQNYIDVIVPGDGGGGDPAPTGARWDPGVYAKIEPYQINYAMTAGHAHMPNPYLPSSTAANHVSGVFGELDRKKWLKGILIECPWSRIETSPGTFNWTFLDFVFNTIRTLPKTTGKDKRVFLLLNFRNFTIDSPEDLIPDDLKTQPSANGGYYKNTSSFPPSAINPYVNAKKYDHVWCYEGKKDGNPTIQPKGYTLNLHKFTAAAGTNTLKTRYYAFLEALAAKYADDEVFAGIMPTEAALGSPFVAFEGGNSRDANYEGRWNIAKKLRQLFPKSVVCEALNFDFAYYNAKTAAGVTGGCVTDKIAFTTPDCDTAKELNLGNIRTVMSGKVPVVMQIQPRMMNSMTGNDDLYYNWPTNPTQVLSAPDATLWNDPPTQQWMMDRIQYFNANYLIFQRNFDTTKTNNWNDWKAYMDANHANDAAGGMVTTKPLIIGA